MTNQNILILAQLSILVSNKLSNDIMDNLNINNNASAELVSRLVYEFYLKNNGITEFDEQNVLDYVKDKVNVLINNNTII